MKALTALQWLCCCHAHPQAAVKHHSPPAPSDRASPPATPGCRCSTTRWRAMPACWTACTPAYAPSTAPSRALRRWVSYPQRGPLQPRLLQQGQAAPSRGGWPAGRQAGPLHSCTPHECQAGAHAAVAAGVHVTGSRQLPTSTMRRAAGQHKSAAVAAVAVRPCQVQLTAPACSLSLGPPPRPTSLSCKPRPRQTPMWCNERLVAAAWVCLLRPMMRRCQRRCLRRSTCWRRALCRARGARSAPSWAPTMWPCGWRTCR